VIHVRAVRSHSPYLAIAFIRVWVTSISQARTDGQAKPTPSHTKVICVPKLIRIGLKFKCQSIAISIYDGHLPKKCTMAKGRFPASAPGAQVGDFNDPASLKPAFASVDEAFVVVNGKDLNRLEANALDRSRAFKRLRFRWPQRARGVGDEERQFLENGVGHTCA
jgi:hypothetical protein